ncbi:DUF4367 domain-containing protein [Candidatus Saccharibacteria bacterium]|nr:DUF4367 domain-containing protein [Candidatus Saccharibacteria bacterium]
MKNDKIVTINGQNYDSVSGLPVEKPQSSSVHSLTQKSKTLYRRATTKPAVHAAPLIRKVGRSMDIARSKSVAHFAPRPSVEPVKATVAKPMASVGPQKHPIAARVESIRAMAPKPVAAAAKSAKDIKEQAIAEAFKKLSEHEKEQKNLHKRNSKMIKRITLIVGVILAILIGYFIYVNMPILSVRVASASAGINASFPQYQPDGYSLSGPVAYSDGQVTRTLHANTGNSKFIIKQARSSWDSSALKNQVNTDSNGEFITTEERGLTIYTYNGNAAWVNGGILYTITGDAPLSGDQIRRIATSL